MISIAPVMTAAPLDIPADIGALFEGIPAWKVPDITDRYDYKKDPGSSDTRHQEDNIRT
jgi:hypothetical protein